jgi:hypothetical protein
MALDQFKEVTFNEGEPLDPNKLNDIQKNTRTSFQASNIVYNSTLNAQSNPIVPVIKSGSINFGDVKMGETKTKILPTDLAIAGLPLPHVVATFRNEVVKGQHVTVSVHEIATNPSITVYVSGKDRANLLVDWIAVTYKEVPTA